MIFFPEIERILNGGKVSGPRDESGHSGQKFCDVTKDKPIKVTVRTYVPTRDHPKVSSDSPDQCRRAGDAGGNVINVPLLFCFSFRRSSISWANCSDPKAIR